MKRLSKEQVISVHTSLINATGGTDGVRDNDLLESALEAPFQTFDGVDLYPTLFQKAARLGFALISNHPFIDGNKRIGIHIMLVFLALNGVDLKFTQQELVNVGLKLASSEMSYEQLLEWICTHS